MLSINTNVASLTAKRNLGSSQKMMSKSLERLSSGLRINRAGDDAAGLAISTAMTSQINGLNQAVRNAGDGISLLNTAEGAIVEQTNILQRMRVLSVQAANDTNSAENRATLQNEIAQLREEMTRISNTVNFNGRNLLDGSFKGMNLQVGADSNQALEISIDDMRASSLGGAVSGASITAYATDAASGDELYINGKKIETTPDGSGAKLSDSSAQSYVNAINAADAGVTATANELTVRGTTDLEGLNAAQTIDATEFNINGVRILDDDLTISSDNTASWSDLAAAINSKSDETGVAASIDEVNGKSYLSLSTQNGETIDLTNTGTEFGVVMAFAAIDETDAAYDGVDDSIFKASYTLTSNEAIEISGTKAADAGLETSALVDSTSSSDSLAAFIAANSDSGIEAGELTINGVDIVVGSFSDDDQFVGALNAQLAGTGVVAAISGNANEVKVTSYSARLEFGGTEAKSIGFTDSVVEDTSGTVDVQESGTTTIENLSVATAEDANNAIQAIDAALAQVSENRSKLGAMTNRLESTISNLNTVSENLAASRSQILDADFATETAELTKAQILQQAGVAILAQANMMPQQALSLLG